MKKWLPMVLMCLCQEALAGPAGDFVSLGRFDNLVVGTWSAGDGNVTLTSTVCGASADTNKANATEPPDNRMPYDFEITDDGAPAGYYLYLDDDDTNTGNATIQVTFSHRDLLEPTAYETLSDGVYDSHVHDGQFKKCNGGDNCDIQMVISSGELEKAQAGDYTGNFTATLRGGSSGTNTDTDSFVATVTVANIVQISGIENVDLGIWSGAPGNLVQESQFCVYSNNLLSGYNVLISSAYQDAGGNFFIKNADESRSIPYTLQFKDDVTPGGGTTVGLTAISGNGNNTDTGCGGVDNAKITVTILAADLTASVADNYDDTLVMLVSPE